MKYRKLRIAWSVAWGVAAVLLCVLWVRSYYYEDWLVGGLTRSQSFNVVSTNSQLGLTIFTGGNFPNIKHFSNPVGPRSHSFAAQESCSLWGFKFKTADELGRFVVVAPLWC